MIIIIIVVLVFTWFSCTYLCNQKHSKERGKLPQILKETLIGHRWIDLTLILVFSRRRTSWTKLSNVIFLIPVGVFHSLLLLFALSPAPALPLSLSHSHLTPKSYFRCGLKLTLPSCKQGTITFAGVVEEWQRKCMLKTDLFNHTTSYKTEPWITFFFQIIFISVKGLMHQITSALIIPIIAFIFQGR